MAPLIPLRLSTEFDFRSDEYRQFFARSCASAFQHPDWLDRFYNYYPESMGAEPQVVVGRSSQTNELVIVFPFIKYIDAGVTIIEYAFGGVTDYALPILKPQVLSALTESGHFGNWLFSALGYHDVLRIEPVREQDASLWRKLTGASPENLGFGAHSIRPQVPYQQWRSVNYGRSRRSQIDRKARRLAEFGALGLRVLNGSDTRQALGLARRWRSGRFPGDPLQTDAGFNFYCDIAFLGSRSGHARTYLLSCGDTPVSVAFGLVDRSHYHYLVLGCDYDTYARYSPGLLILDMMITDWVNTGGTVFDFTIGDEPFKQSFRCQRTSMYRFLRTHSTRGRQYVNSIRYGGKDRNLH